MSVQVKVPSIERRIAEELGVRDGQVAAAVVGSVSGEPISRSASGSRPDSRAIWALVRRLGLNGR